MVALALIGFVNDVRSEGRRGRGARLLGLRLVDARTGGELSQRQKLVRAAVRNAWRIATRQLMPAQHDRSLRESQTALQAELAEAKRQFSEDEEARQEALMRIYREHRVPRRHMLGCWLRLVARFALMLALDAPALWSPANQGLADRLAGTVWVLERPGHHSCDPRRENAAGRGRRRSG